MKRPPEARHRIYINESWYLTVNDRGYLIDSPWAEGALGCVLQLHSEGDHNKVALKIPRLLADTSRENAFIAQLLEREEKVVHVANIGIQQPSGLLRIHLGHRNPLRGVRQLANLPEHIHRQQHEGVILVAFEKGNVPRFCTVRCRDDIIELYPPNVDEPLRIALQHHWETLRRASCLRGADARPFQRTAFIRTAISDEATLAGSLEEQVDTLGGGTIWYAALPSIVFDWAIGTLQEAVARGYTDAPPTGWAIPKHYAMLAGVLRGLETLHGRELIHGDVRPANIMCMGDLATPECYVLGDYGGHILSSAGVEDDRDPTGNTTLGAPVGNHRNSIFYAPERRSGVEHEDADTAVVLTLDSDSPGNAGYIVVAGWKADLLDQSGRLTPQRAEELRREWFDIQDPHATDDTLRHDDRIRLRDFVFTVAESASSDDGHRTFYLCKSRHARVLHDRIAVLDRNGPLADGTMISLARLVELRKWTAATDLYGAGVLLVWSIFMSQSGAESGTRGQDRRAVEVQLHELLEHLCSTPAFKELWDDVHHCAELLWSIDPHERAENLASRVVPVRQDRQATLAAHVTAVVGRILCVPHSYTLFEAFGHNGAHFVLFIHFVLGCLHRRADQPANPRAISGSGVPLPFCADRHHPPKVGGPATSARRYLTGLLERFDCPAFTAFIDRFDETDRERRAPTSTIQLHKRLDAAALANQNLRLDKEALQRNQASLQARLTQAKERAKAVQASSRALLGYNARATRDLLDVLLGPGDLASPSPPKQRT